MLATMIGNLILIHVLSIIWSIGQVTSVETPVHVSRDVYETITQQLTSHPPAVTGLQAAKKKYEYYFESSYSDVNKDSEVCQWGILATELNEPAYDICIIVAVALKDQNNFRQAASSSSSSSSSGVSVTSGYSNYACPQLLVGNVEELELDEEETESGIKKAAQKVLVCPQITINDPSTREQITLEKFLIADGDFEQNSIFVFGFSDAVGEMNLMFYLDNIFKINIIKVSSNSVQNFQRVLLQDLQPEIELNDLCNCPIAERKNVCKYSAMRKFSNTTEQVDLQEEDFDFDATHLDTSGFVPYRCFPRFSSLRLGFAKSEKHIYCPNQVIKVGDSIMAQDGFFYSISEDMYEKRIHIKEAVFPSHRDDHRIQEKTMLPFPLRGCDSSLARILMSLHLQYNFVLESIIDERS